MKKIAVLTSGGDAPGMNAAIRSIVRTGINKGWEMYGILHGYTGLINDNFLPLGAREVGGIIQLGGTMLGSSRCPEFKTEEGQAKAIRTLNAHKIDALCVIGGNGSQSGANTLSKMNYPVIGIASTIDNDLHGSEITIGVDTALNIALEAIDRLKTTASSHQRAFIVEVMGNKCGYLALMAGLAGGAEIIIIPEIEVDPESVAHNLRSAYMRNKTHALVVTAEGAKCNARMLQQFFEENHERLGFELRLTILGHVQRGGSPSAFDRILGTRLGVAAIENIVQDNYGILVGLQKDSPIYTPLSEVAMTKKNIDLKLLDMAKVLAK
jgi:6-phosphofructokinase 1